MSAATRTARVVLDWDGRRWETTGELVRLVDRCELLDPGSSYRPRTAEVDIHLDGVIAWMAAQHHPRSGTAQLYLGERLVLDAPVQSLRPGRQGEPSRVRFGERPELDRSKVPATYEVRIRTIDQELTQARRDGRQAQRDRAIDFYEYARKPVPFELVVNSLTQPTAYSRTVEGRTYPRIYGRPGSNGVIASPALVIDQGRPQVLSDPARLETMLGGLIDRFSRTLPSGSTVTLSLSPAGSRLKLQHSSAGQRNEDPPAAREGEGEERELVGPVLSWNPATGSLQLSRQATQRLFHRLGGRLTERSGSGLTVFFPLC